MLDDQRVYLAFYPRKDWDNGALFSTLAVPNISNLIVEAPGSTADTPRFVLSDDVCQAWEELENFLVEVANYLYSEHIDRNYFPDVEYPTRPNECGYREAHDSPAKVFSCLKKAQHSFRLLSAFLSFTLSLWVTEYEDDCFDRPFQLLMNRTVNPIPPIYLDYLRDSVACRILPGLRPGGFLNPYTTKWGRAMFRFCRFCVPFWLIWGDENMYNTTLPLDRSIKSFLPEPQYIEEVKRCQATFAWLVLPDSKCFGQAPAQPNLPLAPSDSCFDHPLPDYAILNDEILNDDIALADNPPNLTVDRSLVVDTYRTAQRPKETWESFRTRMEEGLKKRKEVESERDRQSREALEANARQHGYSKKTTVFYWEEDDVERGFYRRTKIDRIDVSKYWSECTEHQRFFWGHRKEWDLVPHLRRYPPGHRAETPVEELDIDDDRYNFLYSKPLARKPDDTCKPLSLSRIRVQDNSVDVQSTEQYRFTFVPVTEYLKHRHGFSTSIIDIWNPELHRPTESKKICLEASKWLSALRRLGYSERSNGQVPSIQEELQSIVNFHNVCIAVESRRIHCTGLPPTWDLVSNLWLAQGFEQLRVEIIAREGVSQGKLYVIRPNLYSKDPSTWYVATSSPTAVLFVFRRRLLTMHAIATAFLDLGIPFHTVVERMKEDAPVPPYRYRPRGLDARLKGFKPSESDYLAYIQSRDEVFKSPRARILRLRGGIIGRLALEAVPNVVVLDGPSFCDEVIGHTDNTVFVDDFITENDVDIVSGVYRVAVTDGGGASSDFSWWPKHGTWTRSGLFMDQWTPDAESFYFHRVQSLQKKNWRLKTATTWKETLKYDRLQMQPLYAGSELLAADFICRHFNCAS
jgi:hypothetical protein